MRFIRGDSLKEAIGRFHADAALKDDTGRRSLELRKLLRRFTDVCNAIEYAHSRGVLHRDIKPGNVVLGSHGETLVVDWGLAKATGRSDPGAGERTLVPSSARDSAETLPGSALGTPAYMSPEQAEGNLGRLGPRSDVYSLGATLYYLLTGQPAFVGDAVDVMPRVQRGDFRPPRAVAPAIDRALEAVCLKAMALRPEDRYGSCRALAEDLDRWMADEPVSAWREPMGRRLRRWGRRHRPLMSGLAATLIVAIAALAVGDVLVARQRDRAEKSLAVARQVVEEMYTGVADKLDDRIQIEDYQREILEKALQFYEGFALPQSRDPQVRLEAARAGMHVGGIRSRLGQTAAAEQAERQALEVLSRLVADHPAEPASRDALAQAHRALGAVLRTEERRPESEREIQAAAALWGALAREHPEVAEYRSKLADAHGSLGDHYRRNGRVEAAKESFRQALEVAEALARGHPDVSAYQESLATILAAFAPLQWSNLQDYRGGIASLQRAVAITERIAGDHPGVARHQLNLGEELASLGYGFSIEREFPQAEAAVQRSIGILEKLASLHPQDMKIAVALTEAYGQMKRVLSNRGDDQSALEWSGRAIQALRSVARHDPGNLRVSRRDLSAMLGEIAETWTRLGRLPEALADFREARLGRSCHRQQEPRDVCGLSCADQSPPRRSVGVGASGRPGPPYRSRWSRQGTCTGLYRLDALLRCGLRPRGAGATGSAGPEKPADRAPSAWPSRSATTPWSCCWASRAAGEVSGMIRLDEIQRERLLDPLRSDPRFRLLMMDLTMPADPFAAVR